MLIRFSGRLRALSLLVALVSPVSFEHVLQEFGICTSGIFLSVRRPSFPNKDQRPICGHLRGEVIGINTAMNPRANTIGFTVPINMAKQILPQLRADGHVTRGWLGVVIQGVTPELASEFGLEKEGGALISRVLPDGPAAKSKLQAGDVIVEFNAEPIEEWNELPRVVAGTSVDAKVPLVVMRDGQRKTLEVQVGEMDEPKVVAKAESPAGPAIFGLRAQNLTPGSGPATGGRRGSGGGDCGGGAGQPRFGGRTTPGRCDCGTGSQAGLGRRGPRGSAWKFR